MDDLDEIPDLFGVPSTTGIGAKPRCKHPKDKRRLGLVDGQQITECGRCGHVFDPERQRLGRLNRQRGNRKERDAAKRNGTVRTGHHGGKDDYRTELFAFQNKSFQTTRYPGWMNAELDATRMAWPDREPVLHVEESPGPGRRPRRLYVVDEKTWLALHGPVEDAA